MYINRCKFEFSIRSSFLTLLMTSVSHRHCLHRYV